jgi:hypothetical protein
MQRITLTTRPADGSFEVPFSTGYQTYSGLLSVLDATGEEVADEIHDAPFASFTNSGLIGRFGTDADREYHKTLYGGGDAEYDIHLGIVHPSDRDAFEALIRAFVIEDRNLPLAHGELVIESVGTERTTQRELLDEAAAIAADASGVRIRFLTTTCRERYDGRWEVHPDRTRLFRHLAERWNAAADDDDLRLAPDADSLGEGLITKVETSEYRTNSIVTHRREPGEAGATDPEGRSIAADGGHLNEAQGFEGEWEFHFKGASDALRTAVVALTRFAAYSGVGRHNARGAGTVETEIVGTDP